MYSREDMYVAWEQGYQAGWFKGMDADLASDKNPYEKDADD